MSVNSEWIFCAWRHYWGGSVLVSRDLVEVDQALQMLGELFKVLLPEAEQQREVGALVFRACRQMQRRTEPCSEFSTDTILNQ